MRENFIVRRDEEVKQDEEGRGEEGKRNIISRKKKKKFQNKIRIAFPIKIAKSNIKLYLL